MGANGDAGNLITGSATDYWVSWPADDRVRPRPTATRTPDHFNLGRISGT